MKEIKKGIGICILVILIAVLVAIFFKSKPMIEPENSPGISFISVTLGEDGEVRTYDMSENEISDELADDLVSIFQNIKIRNTLFPPPQRYEILDGSTHITVKVSLENSEILSMFVNLCSDPQYSSAQFGDTHYHIINSQQVYEDVSRLLSDELFSK